MEATDPTMSPRLNEWQVIWSLLTIMKTHDPLPATLQFSLNTKFWAITRIDTAPLGPEVWWRMTERGPGPAQAIAE